jgi:signal transduction histidine kinase
MTTAASPAMAESPARATAGDELQQLMSDVFHDLSQPLSTLTCLLEVNLLLSRPAKKVRHDLKIALHQVHFIVRLFRDLRELVDAGNVSEDQQRLPLNDCLRQVIADVLPMAELAKVKVSLMCESETAASGCMVNFLASRLRQALFHLLEFALGSAATGAEVTITTSEDGEAARLTVAVSPLAILPVATLDAASEVGSAERKQRELKRRLGLAIARCIFEAAGATLLTQNSEERLWIEVRVPLASHEN